MPESRGETWSASYGAWLEDLRPRTCLVVNWLADLEVLNEPGPRVRWQAMRLADKRCLLEMMLLRTQQDVEARSLELLDGGELDAYVAWLMWLRFKEYVPQRFVLPGGRQKVLRWIRQQLRRPELSDAETLVELEWHAGRLHEVWDKADEGPQLRH